MGLRLGLGPRLQAFACHLGAVERKGREFMNTSDRGRAAGRTRHWPSESCQEGRLSWTGSSAPGVCLEGAAFPAFSVVCGVLCWFFLKSKSTFWLVFKGLSLLAPPSQVALAFAFW